MRKLEENSWIFPDPHFGHRKLVERGFRPEGFEAKIQNSWIENVKSDDVVYCLGDVCMGREAEMHETYVRPMPGYKILLRGNHDKQRDAWYLSHGWDEVHMVLKLTATIKGRHTRILLSHIPLAADDSFDVNLHGHFHDDSHRSETPEMVAILCKKHHLLALEHTNYQLLQFPTFLSTI